MRSIQERYGSPETVRAKPKVYTPGNGGTKHEAIYVNETDFETYVQHFPIDDSIAQCFATNFSEDVIPDTKFVSVSIESQTRSGNYIVRTH